MYYRKRYDKKKHIKIYNQLSNRWYYPSGVYYNENKNRYIRYWRGKRSKQLKIVSHRKFRRKHNTSINTKGNYYRRFFDFWWEYD